MRDSWSSGYDRRGPLATICRGYQRLSAVPGLDLEGVVGSLILDYLFEIYLSEPFTLSSVKTSAPPSTIFLAITSAVWRTRSRRR